MEVVLLRWPAEERRREQLRADGVPRLLLVATDASAPMPADDFEDWIRIPADAMDLHLRVETLQRRVSSHSVPAEPVLDADGVLRVGSAWVSLPPVELRLMTTLLDGFGCVVSRDALTRSAWPQGEPRRNALDVHVLRLRRRIAPVGLAIRTVRSRGYVVELSQGAMPNGTSPMSAALFSADDPSEPPHL